VLTIPKTRPQVILTDSIPQDPEYQGLRIVHVQSDGDAAEAFAANRYEFQHQPADYTPIKATLCRKGVIGLGQPQKERVVALLHPTLKMFTDLVRYDPANPPAEDYHALQMKDAHEKTQSDFKGQKATNRDLFRNYILEGITGGRPLFLPVISGWQSRAVFDRTVFVAFDEEDPNALYGLIYLPKSPIMQADGQTQTSALFAVAHSADAVTRGALEKLTVTLEVELNVDAPKAGQSFADRNGRGTKKNRNLVIALDVSAPLSELRTRATEGTVFESRIADGRTTGTSETATTNIVDLSTMEQMLLNAVTGGRLKPEQLKHFHVDTLLPYAQEFLQMLDDLFAEHWPESSARQDTFRRLYVHGWPFALKAIALAYFESRSDELGPRAAAVAARDPSRPQEEVFRERLEQELVDADKIPEVPLDELKRRLAAIDWLRYRKHWVDLTGAKIGKDGKRKTFRLKSTGEEKVQGQAQNTAYIINAVKNKILSATWEELTSQVDASPKGK